MISNSTTFYHTNESPAMPDNVSWSPHLHNNYEILFVYSAENIDFNIGGLKYKLQSFDLLLIKPATIHNLEMPYPQHYERCGFYFPEKEIPEKLRDKVYEFNHIYHLTENDPIFNVINAVAKAETIFAKEDFDEFLKYAVAELLFHLKYKSATDTAKIGVSNDTINKIMKYIDENITEPINAEIISEKFFVSKSWLSHNFKNHVGISLKKYINQKKLVTIENLIQTGLSISRLTEGYSYNNYATFFRQYKQFTGKKPTDDKKDIPLKQKDKTK